MSLVCVLVLFRVSVCAFRVSELLVVRLSFVVKLFCLRCVSCEIPRFSCRVSNSSFSFELAVEIFDSNFEFKFLEFFVSNFEFVFFVSSLNSISRISIFDSNLSSKFSFHCSIRLLEIDRQIRLLEFRCSIRLLEVRVFDSNCRCKCLEFDDSKLSSNFEFVLIYSTSRTSIRIVVEIVVFVSHSSFEFLIELFNFRRNLIIINAIVN